MSWPVPSVPGSDLPGGASAAPRCALCVRLRALPSLSFTPSHLEGLGLFSHGAPLTYNFPSMS